MTLHEKIQKKLCASSEFIDLGLPSSLKWSKCNIGAEKETDYGDYFMWGSTTPNNDTLCDWEHAPFNNGSTSYNPTYFSEVKDTVCPNAILAKEYDAAAQIMGGNWRMPTITDFQELLDNTDNEWVENFNGSDVNGIKLTSKTDTSKYIFIPASGDRSGSSFIDRGIYGVIWNSSLDTELPYSAWNLYFNSGGIFAHSSSSRYFGLPIRGVID